jgi:DNA polymerase III subunit gamma/tau
MATLYRKYRPQTFKEAVGQNHIKITLQNEIGTGKIAHAYLFCGPRAVGKTTFARLLAKAVNCLERKEGEYEPCGKCSSCQEIAVGKSLDIIEIDAASHTGVDNVRENIIASARVTPAKYKYKVFIIDEAHMLSIASFNALLKVMEEPPAHVLFILCTTEIHKVPATIISRCERFDFRRISIEDMVKKLSHIAEKEEVKVDKDILTAIARQAEGHMRDAESLFGQLISISGKEITQVEADLIIPRSDVGEIVKLIGFLANKDASSAISLINKSIEDGIDLEKFISDLVEILRKLLLIKINQSLGERIGFDVGESFEIKLNELKNNLEMGYLILMLEKFIAVRSAMKSSFITQLPAELAIAELCWEKGLVKNISAAVNNEKSKIAPAGKPAEQASSATVNQNPTCYATASAPNQQEIGERWSEVLAKIKKYNHSLSFILHLCQPRNLEGNKLCLAFKYKFHKDRISEAKMKELVQNVLAEVYGSPMIIEAVIDENLVIEEHHEEEMPVVQEIKAIEIEDVPPVEEILENGEEKPVGNNDMMSNLLRTFGGKIVG